MNTQQPTAKKNTENKFKSDHPLDSNEINTLDITSAEQIENILPPIVHNLELQQDQTFMNWSNETELSSPAKNTLDETHNSLLNETYKRQISFSSFSKPTTHRLFQLPLRSFQTRKKSPRKPNYNRDQIRLTDKKNTLKKD